MRPSITPMAWLARLLFCHLAFSSYAFLHNWSLAPPKANQINLMRRCIMSTPPPSSTQEASSSPARPPSSAIPTVNQRTRWQLSLSIKGPSASQNVQADITLRFVERQGYEPPQGYIFIERDSAGLLQVDDKGYADAKWTLSEDKNDRKWGLWVWGLFEEPLYPYIYFSFGLNPKGPGAWIPRQRLDFR